MSQTTASKRIQALTKVDRYQYAGDNSGVTCGQGNRCDIIDRGHAMIKIQADASDILPRHTTAAKWR